MQRLASAGGGGVGGAEGGSSTRVADHEASHLRDMTVLPSTAVKVPMKMPNLGENEKDAEQFAKNAQKILQR